jgi:hypothetical protein
MTLACNRAAAGNRAIATRRQRSSRVRTRFDVRTRLSGQWLALTGLVLARPTTSHLCEPRRATSSAQRQGCVRRSDRAADRLTPCVVYGIRQTHDYARRQSTADRARRLALPEVVGGAAAPHRPAADLCHAGPRRGSALTSMRANSLTRTTRPPSHLCASRIPCTQYADS